MKTLLTSILALLLVAVPANAELSTRAEQALENLTGFNNPMPKGVTRKAEVAALQAINPGQINKLRIRPQVMTEHAESSRTIQSTVTSVLMVGQIFKASADNINSIFLTLESAASTTTIDDVEQADNATLQTAWVLTGTNLATLDTTIKSPNNSSTKSMKLMMDVADVWKNTKAAGSWDMTGATVEFDYYQTKESLKATMTFSIHDGTNASVITLAVPKALKNTWQHFSIPVVSMTGTANAAAVTNVYFTVSLVKVGEFAYVDNVQFRPLPTNVNLELWDMGTTLPVGSTTKLSDGTQYTTLGDLGIGGAVAATITLALEGGKRLYHIEEFVAGVAEEIPTNTKLTAGNYYAIVVKYNDTNVTVYGTDPTFSTDYYTNGFSFTAPDTATAITKLGTNNDMMFGIFATTDVWATEIEVKFFDSAGVKTDASTDNHTSFLLEGPNMEYLHVAANEPVAGNAHEEDLSDRPVLMPKGSKAEIYFSAGDSDSIRQAAIELHYQYAPIQANQ